MRTEEQKAVSETILPDHPLVLDGTGLELLVLLMDDGEDLAAQLDVAGEFRGEGGERVGRRAGLGMRRCVGKAHRGRFFGFWIQGAGLGAGWVFCCCLSWWLRFCRRNLVRARVTREAGLVLTSAGCMSVSLRRRS